MCKTNQERRTLGRKILSWLTFGVFVASQSMDGIGGTDYTR